MPIDTSDFYLDPAARSKLFRFFQTNGTVSIHSRNELICDSNETACDHIHYVKYGYVKVSVLEENGSEFIYLINGKNDIFSFLSLLNASSSNILYVALNKVKVYSVPVATLRQEMASNLELSQGMIQYLLKASLVYASVLENLRHKKANDRLMYGLLLLAVQFGKMQNGKITLDSVFTHKLLGSIINVSRETVSRELEKLRIKGLVSNSGRQLVIDDLNGLQNELDKPLGPNIWEILNTANTPGKNTAKK